jgi:hypothetical protein
MEEVVAQDGEQEHGAESEQEHEGINGDLLGPGQGERNGAGVKEKAKRMALSRTTKLSQKPN